MIKLGTGKIDPLVFDRMDAGAERKQVHEKLLALDRIVRAMDAPLLDVMRNEAVFDGEFANHKISSALGRCFSGSKAGLKPW